MEHVLVTFHGKPKLGYMLSVLLKTALPEIQPPKNLWSNFNEIKPTAFNGNDNQNGYLSTLDIPRFIRGIELVHS